ncbi:MAG: aminoacetone oxidase family FAD-binding enzyme, partial [Bdellovibrionales bacterium]|nr:aminoacetone oxidase family FAD-binding enzyme [Bdellovibrionales bacterium]
MAKRIGIVGGGAAGFFAALSAAESIDAGNIQIFEATKKPLAKVLISGGGRCNVTNSTLNPRELAASYPRGSKELLGPFHRFGVQETVAWFEKRGVELKVESDGRVFPVTDNSSTIANCLKSAVNKAQVSIRTGQKIVQLRDDSEELIITFQNGEKESFQHVILATGGSRGGFALASQLGHTIVPLVPSLFTFEIADELLTDLSGISFQNVALELLVAGKRFKRRGPMLITHWGLSGPAIIQLSSLAARELHECTYRGTLTVSFLPEESEESLLNWLATEQQSSPKKELLAFAPEGIPKRFWERVLCLNGLDPKIRIHDVSSKLLRKT